MRSFFQSYQTLASFVQAKCEAEQLIEQIDERWLVDCTKEFAKAKWSKYHYRFNNFSPEEFRNGKKVGGRHSIDLAAYRGSDTSQAVPALICEFKLMRHDSDWAKEIICDLFRVASIRKHTTSYTHRLVLVVGQEHYWEQIRSRCNGLIPKLCPLDRRHSYRSARLTNVAYNTKLTENWKKDNLAHLEDYLHPHIPDSIKVELVGMKLSNRDIDEKREFGMSARLWRVYPRRSTRRNGTAASSTEVEGSSV